VVSKKPESQPAILPMEHVMAFNAVSANCYVGEAIAQRIDGSLDDEPDFDIIIFAKDRQQVLKACEYLGLKCTIEKSQPVAVANMKDIRVIRKDAMVHGQSKPSNDDL
jgi:hypothetical protein